MEPRALDLSNPAMVRLACRQNRLPIYPSQTLTGYLCVNVVMMNRDYACEFRAFCHANPASCPLLEMLLPGEFSAPKYAVNLDIRTDLRSYDVIQYGVKSESVTSVEAVFTPETVTFLIGSSVSLDGYLAEQGLGSLWGPCIYLTNRDCKTVGRFQGKMAVTMRAYSPRIADKVADVTSHFPACHGGPIARNDPASLGIVDERNPYFPWVDGEFPGAGLDKLYWPCGITPSLVAKAARIPLMVVHTPGNALITDIRTASLYDRFEIVSGASDGAA